MNVARRPAGKGPREEGRMDTVRGGTGGNEDNDYMIFATQPYVSDVLKDQLTDDGKGDLSFELVALGGEALGRTFKHLGGMMMMMVMVMMMML